MQCVIAASNSFSSFYEITVLHIAHFFNLHCVTFLVQDDVKTQISDLGRSCIPSEIVHAGARPSDASDHLIPVANIMYVFHL